MNEIIEIFSLNFSGAFRLRDVADLIVVTVIVYKLLGLLKGKRAMQMILGLGLVFVFYIVSGKLGLFTINWILSEFLGAIIIIIVVLFQNDIRKALTRIGHGSPFQKFLKQSDHNEKSVDEIVKAANYMANNKIGAIIAIERINSLMDYTEGGMAVNTAVSAEILISIFNPGSPFHDGAAIIQGNQITSAGCFFPIDTNPDIPNHLGTRHRAAIGLANENDAVVIVVSEERGEISLIVQEEQNFRIDVTALRSALKSMLESESGERKEKSEK